ncbi:MAG: CvpA family protein [Clostridia bacterium]|nr:CvpA family protein [Clostridia bacterium]
MNGNYLDILFLVLFIVSCLFSYLRGFLKRISTTVALTVSLIAGILWLSVFSQYFHFSHEYDALIVLIIIAIAAFILVKVAMRKVSKTVSPNLLFGTMDKVLGLLVGAVQAICISFVIAYVLHLFAKDIAAESLVIRFFVQNFIQ